MLFQMNNCISLNPLKRLYMFLLCTFFVFDYFLSISIKNRREEKNYFLNLVIVSEVYFESQRLFCGYHLFR